MELDFAIGAEYPMFSCRIESSTLRNDAIPSNKHKIESTKKSEFLEFHNSLRDFTLYDVCRKLLAVLFSAVDNHPNDAI